MNESGTSVSGIPVTVSGVRGGAPNVQEATGARWCAPTSARYRCQIRYHIQYIQQGKGARKCVIVTEGYRNHTINTIG